MVKAVIVQFRDGTKKEFKAVKLCVKTLWDDGYRFKFYPASKPLKIDDRRIRNWIKKKSHQDYGVQRIVDKEDRRGSIVKFAWG